MISIDRFELVNAALNGADAHDRGILRHHNPFALTAVVARVRGEQAVLLCVQAAAWWAGWDRARTLD